jgi:hypothetical protein
VSKQWEQVSLVIVIPRWDRPETRLKDGGIAMPTGCMGCGPISKFVRLASGLLGAVVIVAVPSFAVSAFAPRTQVAVESTGFTPLSAAEELMAYGPTVRPKQAPGNQSVSAQGVGDGLDTTFMKSWQFTRTKPSGQP